MSTTRRALLRGLGALPIASIPVAMTLPATAASSADARLLSLAATTLALNERFDDWLRREMEVENRYLFAGPPKPRPPR